MRNTIKRMATPVALGLATVAVSSASAQGGFTLFGDSSPKPTAEQKFVRPVSAPYFHEDSFVTTDIRPWFVDHRFHSDTVSGNAQVYAAQLRLALTSNLQLVVYKGGYIDFNDTLNDEGGWNDHAAGLKWAFIQNWERQFHMAAGLGYEFGIGDSDVLQGTDEVRLWLSANKGFGPLHLGATANYRIATDNNDGALGSADMVTLHLHADYYVNSWFSPVVEVNGYFVTDAGPGGASFSGVDAGAIGGGQDEDTITGAIGAEFRPLGPDLGLRVAYETQLTDNQSLFGHRWTFSAVYEF